MLGAKVVVRLFVLRLSVTDVLWLTGIA